MSLDYLPLAGLCLFSAISTVTAPPPQEIKQNHTAVTDILTFIELFQLAHPSIAAFAGCLDVSVDCPAWGIDLITAWFGRCC